MKNSIYKIIMLIAICLLAITMGFLLPKTFSKYTKTKTVNINLSIRNPKYTIVFHANPPQGTTPTGTMANQELEYDETQNLNSNNYKINDYRFLGWTFVPDGTEVIYSDEQAVSNLTAIEGETIDLFAKWKKIERATFDTGIKLNVKMKALSGQAGATETTTNTTINAFKKATTLKTGLTSNNIVSSTGSDKEIYMWYENGTIYYYSDAEEIYFNADSGKVFYRLTGLSDISGLSEINTSKVTSSRWMFRSCASLADLTPLADWNTSNITNMDIMFGSENSFVDQATGKGIQITDLTPLKNWDISKVTTMNQMFKGNVKLRSFSGLEKWNVSKVTNYTNMFEKVYSLEDASAIDGWDINVNATFSDMFSAVPSSIRPNWNGRWIRGASDNSTFVPNR